MKGYFDIANLVNTLRCSLSFLTCFQDVLCLTERYGVGRGCISGILEKWKNVKNVLLDRTCLSMLLNVLKDNQKGLLLRYYGVVS